MNVETDTRAGRQRRNRLPHNRQRERVLRIVREHDGPIDAAKVASEIGLHVTTVRFHLDALCDEGAIKRTRLTRPGAGRPRTGYVAVEERLDYRVLAGILAMELGQNEETRARRAQHAGREWAARLTASTREDNDLGGESPGIDTTDTLEQAAARATVAFTWLGFAPELLSATEQPTPPPADGKPGFQPERTIRLHACPVRDLARSHPEVICGLHLGLLQGMLTDKANRGVRRPLSAHIEPFVQPELCVARLARNDRDR